MNYALVFAGGVGKRMNSKARPKQFLEIHGKPIIIQTIEHFENHSAIDAICVVCVAEWIDYLKNLLLKYNIKKVHWVVEGEETALRSQYKGLLEISQNSDGCKKDIVLIHDGVRPLINDKLVSDCIEGVKRYGSAITVAPAIETIIRSDEEDNVIEVMPRSECLLARAPQCFYMQQILEIHHKSITQGKHDFIDSASMMLHHGYQLHTVEGPTENIKVTTPTDFYICRALLDAKENTQIYGI